MYDNDTNGYFSVNIDPGVKDGEIVIEGAKFTGNVAAIHRIGVAMYCEKLKVAMCHEGTDKVAHISENTYGKLGLEPGGDILYLQQLDLEPRTKVGPVGRLIDADALIKASDGNPLTTDSVKSYIRALVATMPPIEQDNSCDGCRYDNADDGVLVPCGFCKRSHPDNYER